MNKLTHSKNNIFLLEMLINILLFIALMIVGLTFFIKTHTTTISTRILHEAVTCCDNAATVFESSNGNIDAFSKQYPNSILSDDKIFIYFDKNFDECNSIYSSYKIVISINNHDRLSEADVQFLDSNNKKIYDITTSSYTPLTVDSAEVTTQ